MIFTLISSFLSFSKLAFKASKDPCTSAFKITGKAFRLPSLILAPSSSILTLVDLLSSFWRLYSWRLLAYSLASLSVFTAIKISPASATSLSPMITPHSPGLISFKALP